VKVYLVPASDGRHELYCEVSSIPTAAPNDPSIDPRGGSLWSRLVDGFRRMAAEGEAAEHGDPQVPDRGRVRRAITRKVAEAVAEQRLLWNLRHVAAVDLVHPDDVGGPEALATARGLIDADYAKHRRWCIIDALIASVTGPAFFFVPGPNVISWYFAFRAVGHFFALRGARRGLTSVTWTTTPSRELSDLRRALTLDAELRARRVEEIAAALGLGRLAFFVKKIA
jgi:hypothetical protein